MISVLAGWVVDDVLRYVYVLSNHGPRVLVIEMALVVLAAAVVWTGWWLRREGRVRPRHGSTPLVPLAGAPARSPRWLFRKVLGSSPS